MFLLLGTALAAPVVVIGVDGGEWSVVEALWEQGELPNLKALAERGTTAPLASHYGESPVIWTSMATGMKDTTHGITGFTVFSPDGDVPFSSTLRKTPALWNMVSDAGKTVGVVSWWATWPAESVNGYIVSERADGETKERVSPAPWLAQFEATPIPEGPFKGSGDFEPQDRLSLHYGESWAKQDMDLTMAYFRGVDSVSHKYWKYWEPETFNIPAAELAKNKHIVPDKYKQTDVAIGRLVAANPDANIFVISDHGFHAADGEDVRITLDINQVLAEMGLAVYTNGKLDKNKSKVYAKDSQVHEKRKKLTFNAKLVPKDQVSAMQAEVVEALRDVTFDTGKPAFDVRKAGDAEVSKGYTVIARVNDKADAVSKVLIVNGKEFTGAIPRISMISGNHPDSPPGLFLAAGPDIAKGAKISIDIHDIAPTVLYGMGLPVGKDMDGKAVVGVYKPGWQKANPLKQVDSWGASKEGTITTSDEDEAHLEQLRALGYID